MSTVIHVVQNLSPGGLEVMALELKKAQDKNNTVKIVSLEGEKDIAIGRWPRLKAFESDIIFLGKNPGWDMALFRQLILMFQRVKPVVIHTHHIGPLIYAGIAAKLSGVENVIHTEHDAWHLNCDNRCMLERVALFLVNPKLVADADIVANKIKEKLKRKNVSVIKNGIDVKHFSPGNSTSSREKLGLPVNVKLVGTAGRLEAVKGQEYLLKAMTSLPENVHLAVAGIGSLEHQLKLLSREYGIDDRVWFLGGVDDMPIFYQALDVFCLPSLQEGLPLSVLEAQACGIPAIVTDVGGCSEALCRQSGVLTPPKNSQELAVGIKKILFSGDMSDPRDFVKREGNLNLMVQAYADLVAAHKEVA